MLATSDGIPAVAFAPSPANPIRQPTRTLPHTIQPLPVPGIQHRPVMPRISGPAPRNFSPSLRPRRHRNKQFPTPAMNPNLTIHQRTPLASKTLTRRPLQRRHQSVSAPALPGAARRTAPKRNGTPLEKQQGRPRHAHPRLIPRRRGEKDDDRQHEPC